jgi:hypothetical protein
VGVLVPHEDGEVGADEHGEHGGDDEDVQHVEAFEERRAGELATEHE